ncbi:TOBE domain-containing protein [Pseudoroseomonas wenyumeiae]
MPAGSSSSPPPRKSSSARQRASSPPSSAAPRASGVCWNPAGCCGRRAAPRCAPPVPRRPGGRKPSCAPTACACWARTRGRPGIENLLEGTLSRRIYTGEVVSLEAQTAAGPVTAEVHASAEGAWREMQPGAPLRLAFRASDLLVFPAQEAAA